VFRLAARLTAVVRGSSCLALSCQRLESHSSTVDTAKVEQCMLVVGVDRQAVVDVEGVAIVAAAVEGYMFGFDTAAAVVVAGSLEVDHIVLALVHGLGAADNSGSFADVVVGHRQPAFRSA
jgi:hypothetical protein